MNAQNRQPKFCQFRRVDTTSAGSSAICELVSRVAGGVATPKCQVNHDICKACCRHPLPDGPRLNPVVASLVFSAVQRDCKRMSLSASERLAIEHTRQFAIRWLASGDDANSACDELFDPRDIRAVDRMPGLRIGLVGRNSRFGLGHVNRDMAVQLGIDRWLVPCIPDCRDLPASDLPCRIDTVPYDPRRSELAGWLVGLDALVFVECPVFSGLTSLARQLGVRVICVPMWEWLHPGLEWLDDVDLMLCPTRYTEGLLSDWKSRFGFHWEMETVPWPIDVHRFRFRARRVCQEFVFVNGSGGAAATTEHMSKTLFRRKGLDVLLAAAQRVPDIPIIVYAVAKDVPSLPSNVQLRQPPADNTLLYCDGDVCIQPSHWEGLGLPLLECQASGMPLVTTDLPPMNEHDPLAAIPAVEEAVYLHSELCIAAARIEPDELANVMRSVYGRPIAKASTRARQFVEREHSWRIAGPQILQSIGRLVASGARAF